MVKKDYGSHTDIKMTFASKLLRKTDNVIGDKAVTVGTWSAPAETSGNINTHLEVCDLLIPVLADGGAGTSKPVPAVTGTAFPTGGSSVNISCNVGQYGIWLAYGHI